MVVDWVRLYRFRNYLDETVSFSPGINVLYGENAQGKTNLLEAVFYLSGARSFRSFRERDMIAFCEPQAAVCARVVHPDREFLLEARLSAAARRRIQVNGVRQAGAAGLSGILNTVTFLPDDLDIVREGPALRRKYLDAALSQLRPRYLKALCEYNRLFEHKSRILKDLGEKPSLLDTLDVFSRRMAYFGSVLINYRNAYLKKLLPIVKSLHSDISGGRDEIGLSYKTVSAVADPGMPGKELELLLYEHMLSLRPAEIDARSCLTGPHKDDVEITINGNSAKTFGSQGQARSAALSLKLAERQIFFGETGQYPVLLLDDVLSELDERRRDFVLNRIEGGQVLITCCENGLVRTAGRVLHVENGRVTAE